MAKAANAGLAWQQARVMAIIDQTPTVKSFFLMPAAWTSFAAGQHLDVRLTAPDGYQAQRSYSIASAPGDSIIELAIERLADGEVSPFFHDTLAVGDTIEMRGPIGGHFVWGAHDGGPILLIGGGSGVVPLISIARHRSVSADSVPAALIYSVRQVDDIIYRDELIQRAMGDIGFNLFVTVTRDTPPPPLRSGRIDADIVDDALASLGEAPIHTYICGTNAFVDAASDLAIARGVPFETIRTERYGGDVSAPGEVPAT
jgi:ferredoxin-NADP reductase